MKSMIRFLVVLIWFSPALAAAQFAPCSVAPLPYLVTTPSQPTASQVLKVTIAEFNFIPRRTEPEVGGRLHLHLDCRRLAVRGRGARPVLASVVGWSMQSSMTSQLVADALMMAVWRRGQPIELLHHSDQGSQPGVNRSSQHSRFRWIVALRSALRPAFAN